MAISRSEAIAQVEAAVNAMDLDWPTKPTHVVYDELTQESRYAWLFFYGIPVDMRVAGRDAEPGENPPYRVDKETGEMELGGQL
jgi:hypothetical protein